MKKILFALFLIAASIQLTFAKDEISKDYDVLPQSAKEFITKYFPNQEFNHIKIDGMFEKKEFEVYFKSGIVAEFNSHGEWKEVSSKTVILPTNFIPQSINDYIIVNYPNQQIYKIQKKRYGYEIDLSNDKELIFDKNGNFKRVDK